MADFQTRRLMFHNKLVAAGGDKVKAVYFQPGSDDEMSYPCIVYELDNATLRSANNMPYTWVPRYQVTLMDYDPDNDVKTKLAQLPLSSFSRHFATSGLNHDVFTIYH